MIRGTRPVFTSAHKLALFATRTAFTPSRALAPPLLAFRYAAKPPTRTQWTQYSTKGPVSQKPISPEDAKKIGQQKLAPARPIPELGGQHTPREPDVRKDLAADLHRVQEAMAFPSVPRESYMLGLAGTVPYLATSLSTVFLSWNLNADWPTGWAVLDRVFLSHETAARLLEHLELVQISYGAVILSFLGAIHWGLEFAETRPARPRTSFRYGLGLAAPAVAWSTVVLPVEWALTSQFLAFTAMYFADARATERGWTPAWYGTYRFMLTAIVGASIVLSLIARAKAGHERPRLSTGDLRQTMEYKHQGDGENHKKWERLEEKEKEKNRREEEAKQKREEEKKKEKEKEKKKTDKKEGKEEEEGKGKDKSAKPDQGQDKTPDSKDSQGKGAEQDGDERKDDSAKAGEEKTSSQDKGK